MKIIKYKFCTKVNIGDDESPEWEDVIRCTSMPYSEQNEAIAISEAYNGEYSIEDDGVEEVSEPSQLDIIEAQVTYTAMMTDTLLEG